MKRDSFLRLLYGKLASIRTSVYILSVMAFFFMAGAIFPQGEKLEDYIKAGGRFVAFVKLFGLLDFFSSPLFLIAAFVLFLNLAVCTYERFFAIRSPRRYPKEFTPTHSITLTQDEADAVTETRRVLKDKLGFRLVSKDN
ncbi:MAG: cytochrome c biogenesis protein ResB, partial [Deltaproteobacteria bacterium]|nr:cytochrome c biogenesis protein ResB [Deltaproteobacteria bacterium]